ncbi:MAG: ATP-binding cassette domain-containing protein [Succinivibrionaceae bacterium]|nr:ATP-binding cassette domain-containing protein [Succinivibrionaceae bacterium]
MIAANELFHNASAQINPGEKVGLVGKNGSGKSTLFSLITGEHAPDGGEIFIPDDWVVASVAQETPALATKSIDYVIEGDRRYTELQERLKRATADNDGEAIGRIHAEIEIADGYTIRSRAAVILSGLGFSEGEHGKPVKEFSGGWRMRLNLAQALIVKSDLLLLDEPTNHLDLDAVIFLENYLAGYGGTLLLISHDRDFLDHTVGKIIHIEGRQLHEYTANYSGFEVMRMEKMNQQQALHEKQQAAIAHMKAFVERFRYKATKARQAQSRLKALERMDLIAAAHSDSNFTFAFREPDALPNPLIQMEELSLGYGERVVLSKIHFNLTSGARIGLLGKNGAGKSTLVKCLAGELAPLKGRYRCSSGVQIGYFAQEQLEHLRLEDSPLKHMQRLAPECRELELRSYLGSFNFSGDKVNCPASVLSGGEKARLALALIVWRKPNLLLLDEPTNHLDLDMREALTLALQNYSGALVVVSHDRHLLKSATDLLYLVDDGRVSEFDGDLDDYQKYLLDKQRSQQAQLKECRMLQKKAEQKSSPQISRALMKQLQSKFRDETKDLRKAIADLAAKLEQIQRDESGYEQALADNVIYDAQNRDRLNELLTSRGELLKQKDLVEEMWLEQSQLLEEKQKEFDMRLREMQSC